MQSRQGLITEALRQFLNSPVALENPRLREEMWEKAIETERKFENALLDQRAELLVTNTGLKNDKKTLEEENEKLKQEVVMLKNRQSALEVELLMLPQENDRLSREVVALRTENSVLFNDNREFIQENKRQGLKILVAKGEYLWDMTRANKLSGRLARENETLKTEHQELKRKYDQLSCSLADGSAAHP